ncbi:MAG: hypothetical protein B5M56_05250 [Desulfococcus sp. 4484_241]|nr:MAG: hypothetical protein B5M56_05250 [Desulfococcus sp. 4484_241]RLC33792.1 MAG: hypothetical protein DRH32_00310 [Deltaproteobacteria bacterium]
MGKSRKTVPDFFDETGLDPVKAVTGARKVSSEEEKKKAPDVVKKKAGFYIDADLLDRFDRVFYQLKLEGVAVGNKSMLLEAVLRFAMDDIKKGKKSSVRRMFISR